MKAKSIDIHLSVEVSGNDVIAYLQFSNENSDKVYLDTWTICTDNVFRRDIFSITDEHGNKIGYSGMMVKREVKPEDFIAIDTGEKMNMNITVNKAYKLIKGKKYIIQFCAYNPTYLNMQGLMPMQSNSVEINY